MKLPEWVTYRNLLLFLLAMVLLGGNQVATTNQSILDDVTGFVNSRPEYQQAMLYIAGAIVALIVIGSLVVRKR